ncbi:MAG TPA: DUF5672 family protein [Casimicrobiaceae bacterium]|jgi:Tfp pilus assembly protein PilF
MITLPTVTLCCIDTRNHALALRALLLSMTNVAFARVLFITDRDPRQRGIDTVPIPPLESRDGYSGFVLKQLRQHIATDHVLLVQWDGYVVEPASWQSEFLACDYIGAKWPWHGDGHTVGNGGFSLRSRKLLTALADPRIVLQGNEDDTICRHQRPLLEAEFGIRFASEPLADQFSFEADFPVGRPFGFHALFNFWRVVPDLDMARLVPGLPPHIVRTPQCFQLGRNYLNAGQLALANAIFARIVDADPSNHEAVLALATARSLPARSPIGQISPRAPCPCGSGKRYKNCHGGRASSVVTGDKAATVLADQRVRVAVALHQRGDLSGAEAIYRSVLGTDRGHPAAQRFLGSLLYQRDDVAEALPLLSTAARRMPDDADCHCDFGLALSASNRTGEAIAAFRRALALAPDHLQAMNNLGLALLSENRPDEAIAVLRPAVGQAPQSAEVHWNLALALLLRGDYEQGWHEYEWRRKLPGQASQFAAGPTWDGALRKGLRLLVYPEQGFGDAIQFARYLRPLVAAGVRPIVHCAAALARLLASGGESITVVPAGQPLPDYDAHAPLPSLAAAFTSSVDTIPRTVPYLRPPDEAMRRWQHRLLPYARSRKIGLAWAGRRRNRHERKRPISLSMLRSWAALPETTFFSLQKDDGATESLIWPGPAPLVDWSAELTDFAETAALLGGLDLVISVDSAVAHLAGALASPVWILLPYAADWRWLLDREDSPWYPTARLFRQQRPGDWSSVVTAVERALIGDPAETTSS